MVSSTTYESAGWGLARYDWEALREDVRGQAAYVVQRFGWWYLDWKVGDKGFELRTPTAELSLTDLLALAYVLDVQR